MIKKIQSKFVLIYQTSPRPSRARGDVWNYSKLFEIREKPQKQSHTRANGALGQIFAFKRSHTRSDIYVRPRFIFYKLPQKNRALYRASVTRFADIGQIPEGSFYFIFIFFPKR